MKLKLFTIALLTLFAVSCTRDDLTLPEGTMVEEVTVSVIVSPETRVAYNGGTGNNALSWENNDKLLLLGYDANNTFKGKTTFTWTGTGNKFSGQPVPGATTYKAYYPEGATTVDQNGNVQPIANTFWQQTQNGNNSVAHIGTKLILRDEIPNPLSQPFALTAKSSILKFDLTNLPDTLGTLKKMIWTVQDTPEGMTRSMVLDLTGISISSGSTNLTAYLAFDPLLMKISANGVFKITLIGDRSCEWSIVTGNQGKTYAEGTRYNANVSANWKGVVPLIYTVRTYNPNIEHQVWQKNNTSINPANLTIYWGDGTANTSFAQGSTLNKTLASHIYANSGSYTVTIISDQGNFSNQQMPQIHFYNGSIGSQSLTAVLTPFPNMTATDFSFCFRACSQLTSIPADLFKYNKQATTFSNCFNGCTKLTSIPTGLFDHTIQVTDFSSCFRGCNNASLTTIPADLFKYNTQATNFSYCFSGCGNLTTIPNGLFHYNTQATNFSYCFNDCLKLVLIQGIFPDPDIGTNNDFFLVRGAMNFQRCFYKVASNYSDPTGIAPKLWDFNKGGAWTITECFTNATKLTNYYTEIPVAWGGGKN